LSVHGGCSLCLKRVPLFCNRSCGIAASHLGFLCQHPALFLPRKNRETPLLSPFRNFSFLDAFFFPFPVPEVLGFLKGSFFKSVLSLLPLTSEILCARPCLFVIALCPRRVLAQECFGFSDTVLGRISSVGDQSPRCRTRSFFLGIHPFSCLPVSVCPAGFLVICLVLRFTPSPVFFLF